MEVYNIGSYSNITTRGITSAYRFGSGSRITIGKEIRFNIEKIRLRVVYTRGNSVYKSTDYRNISYRVMVIVVYYQ